MMAMREESVNLRRAEEDRERALALLPDADVVLPSSVANVIAAPRRIVSSLNRRAMMKSGETPAALKIAWQSDPQSCSASSSLMSAAMPRADESVHSFESTQSDTDVSVEFEDEEEQDDDYEDGDYSSDFSD
jgi:hypothetical protein